MIKDEVKIVSVHSWSLARILHNKTDDLNNKWNQEMLQGKQVRSAVMQCWQNLLLVTKSSWLVGPGFFGN